MIDWRTLWREPLVHFLVIGAALFLAFDLTREEGGDAANLIRIDAGQVEQLAAQFQRTWLRPPTGQELAGLVEGRVREEVYYREALAMGLDRNDPQVRQRMRLKLEFLLEDLTAEAPPADETLLAYLEKHPERFRVEPRFSFRQVYLNPDRREALAADSERLLAELLAGAEPDSAGDPTLLPLEQRNVSPSEIARTFGETFAAKVAALEPGRWRGPIYSGLGAHLVLVTERREGRLPGLEEVRSEVERDYSAQRRQELKDLAYQKLRERYQVVIEPAAMKGEEGVVTTAEGAVEE